MPRHNEQGFVQGKVQEKSNFSVGSVLKYFLNFIHLFFKCSKTLSTEKSDFSRAFLCTNPGSLRLGTIYPGPRDSHRAEQFKPKIWRQSQIVPPRLVFNLAIYRVFQKKFVLRFC